MQSLGPDGYSSRCSHGSGSSAVCRQVACHHSSSAGILDERRSLGSRFEAAVTRVRSKTTLGNPPKSSISQSFADEVKTHLSEAIRRLTMPHQERAQRPLFMANHALSLCIVTAYALRRCTSCTCKAKAERIIPEKNPPATGLHGQIMECLQFSGTYGRMSSTC